MKKTDKAVELFKNDIEDKVILEVACGGADFSISASKYAKIIYCIDLDDSRIKSKSLGDNINFELMDASNMEFVDETFDNVFLYNAFFHVQTQWIKIENECRRVLKPNGKIFIIGTWKLDTNLMFDVFGDRVKQCDEFFAVEIINQHDKT